jgi:hypothetical protein
LILFGVGLSRLTTDEKLQGAFAPFGRLLEGKKLSFKYLLEICHPFPHS